MRSRSSRTAWAVVVASVVVIAGVALLRQVAARSPTNLWVEEGTLSVSLEPGGRPLKMYVVGRVAIPRVAEVKGDGTTVVSTTADMISVAVVTAPTWLEEVMRGGAAEPSEVREYLRTGAEARVHVRSGETSRWLQFSLGE